MNHIAEDMIHRNTISTRVRLPGLRGKIVKGKPIDDPSIYHRNELATAKRGGGLVIPNETFVVTSTE